MDAAGKARSEAISHEPAFDLPDHHPMHGKSGVEMVKWVLQHEAEEMRAWRTKHGEKLRFGKNLQAEETEEMTTLLYALRDVFAENPKAPAVTNGTEFALEDSPRPMCRKLPRLSIKEKEHMSKDALQMPINDVIEFSDSDWATVPVFAKKADGSLRFAIDYR